MRGVPRPLLANPDEVWQWEGHGGLFYVIRYDHRASRGQMFKALDLGVGSLTDVFMTYERFNGWTRVA